MDCVLRKDINLDLNELVKYYYELTPKLTLQEICSLINMHHRCDVTTRRVKYIIQKLGLSRRKIESVLLARAISNELDTSRSLVGYRQMAEIISLKYGVQVSKEATRLALLNVDPEGVQRRRTNAIKRRVYDSKGPGDIYHIDGNDKLKKWGICIHGGIDGFSRKLLWLKASTTNNNPVAIAHYYIQSLEANGFSPKILRMDKGTENTYCEKIQTFLTNDDESFIYAKSTHNQRIEAFWSRLKKFRLSWWIDFFKNMEKNKIYKSQLESHQEVLIFCFLPIVQNELNEFYQTWNRRNIRQSASALGGRPEILFVAPETVGYSHHGIPFVLRDMDIVKRNLGITEAPYCRNNELHELLIGYVHLNNLNVPCDAYEGLELYGNLLDLLRMDEFEV